MEFRLLTEDDIDCRVASVAKSGKGLNLLLYKNARVDMNILDETVGVFGWSRDHKELKENIYCGISIKDPDSGEWITKWDAGKESYSDSEKGEASDSFKRAGFNWGIGRELYTAPFVWVNSSDCNITNGKCQDRFSVHKIGYEGHKICTLEIRNDTTKKIIFKMGSYMSEPTISPFEADDINSKIKGTKLTATAICKAYGVKNIKDIPQSKLNDCYDRINAYKARSAK